MVLADDPGSVLADDPVPGDVVADNKILSAKLDPDAVAQKVAGDFTKVQDVSKAVVVVNGAADVMADVTSGKRVITADDIVGYGWDDQGELVTLFAGVQ